MQSMKQIQDQQKKVVSVLHVSITQEHISDIFLKLRRCQACAYASCIINLYLHQDGGYASGGFLADTKVAGTVSGGSQQQWLTRNSEMSNFEGVVWNNVLVGCGSNVKGVGKGWPYAANTVVEKTPEEVEKPFLTVKDGEYSVFVPKVKNNTVGVSWSGDKVDGEFIDLDKLIVQIPTL